VPIFVSELKWPFHASNSGADWFVLHGRAELLGGEHVRLFDGVPVLRVLAGDERLGIEVLVDRAEPG